MPSYDPCIEFKLNYSHNKWSIRLLMKVKNTEYILRDS
jgi:hypothetical protein